MQRGFLCSSSLTFYSLQQGSYKSFLLRKLGHRIKNTQHGNTVYYYIEQKIWLINYDNGISLLLMLKGTFKYCEIYLEKEKLLHVFINCFSPLCLSFCSSFLCYFPLRECTYPTLNICFGLLKGKGRLWVGRRQSFTLLFFKWIL